MIRIFLEPGKFGEPVTGMIWHQDSFAIYKVRIQQQTESGWEDAPVVFANCCPKCGKPLRLIQNLRMDEKVETIPICDECKGAWRDPALGWSVE